MKHNKEKNYIDYYIEQFGSFLKTFFWIALILIMYASIYVVPAYVLAILIKWRAKSSFSVSYIAFVTVVLWTIISIVYSLISGNLIYPWNITASEGELDQNLDDNIFYYTAMSVIATFHLVIDLYLFGKRDLD